MESPLGSLMSPLMIFKIIRGAAIHATIQQWDFNNCGLHYWYFSLLENSFYPAFENQDKFTVPHK